MTVGDELWMIIGIDEWSKAVRHCEQTAFGISFARFVDGFFVAVKVES